jgi:hypothetical protein
VPEIFDQKGRLQFDPEYHPNHRTSWSESDLEYLCKYAEIDGYRKISMALGRTEKTCSSKLDKLKQNGRYEYYKNSNKHW